MTIRPRLLVIAAALAAALPLSAQQSWYVDGLNGSDLNGGTMATNAFATINFALASASAGDSIYVMPATYDEALVITQDIELIAYPTATIAPSSGAFSAVLFSPPSGTGLSNACRLRGFTIRTNNDMAEGIRIFGGNTDEKVSPVIEGNTVIDFLTGVRIEVPNGSPVIRLNDFRGPHQGSLTGIYLANGSPAIKGNSVRDFEVGINLETIATLSSCVVSDAEYGVIDRAGNVLRNFTVADCYHYSFPGSGNAFGVEGNGLTLIENSILWSPLAYDLSNATADSFTFIEDSGVWPDPEFRNSASRDYRLSGTSPAIDLAPAVFRSDNSYDRGAQSRLLDPFHTGALRLDSGAWEFSTIEMQMLPEVLGQPLAPFRTADLGSSVILRFVNHRPFAGGNPGLAVYWAKRPQGVLEWSALIDPLGIRLTPSVSSQDINGPLALDPMTHSATATIQIPNRAGLTGTDFLIQGLIVDSLPLPQAIGSATRLLTLRITDPS